MRCNNKNAVSQLSRFCSTGLLCATLVASSAAAKAEQASAPAAPAKDGQILKPVQAGSPVIKTDLLKPEEKATPPKKAAVKVINKPIPVPKAAKPEADAAKATPSPKAEPLVDDGKTVSGKPQIEKAAPKPVSSPDTKVDSANSDAKPAVEKEKGTEQKSDAVLEAEKPIEASPQVAAYQAPDDPVLAAIHKQLGLDKAPAIKPSVPASQPDSDEKAKNKPAAPRETVSASKALKLFYSAAEARPLWVDGQGLTAKAKAVLAEFAAADQYGLRPQDFAFATPTTTSSEKPDAATQAATELQISKLVQKYARYAKGGRIDPRKLSRFQDRGPRTPDYPALFKQLQSDEDPVKALRAQHPRHPQFEQLRRKLIALSSGSPKTTPNNTTPNKVARFPLGGKTLRPGMQHPHVALLRKRLKTPAAEVAQANQYDDELVAAVKKYQLSNGLSADGIVGSGTRRSLAGIKASGSTEGSAKLRARLLINMERWRWMPERLQGDSGVYVWANIPELRTRILKNGKVIFDEKAIAGLPNKQTPMFSDEMEWIEFNPTWFIPNSIKVADVLPSLRRKGRVMQRYHLNVDCGRHGRDWRAIDWSKVDIRKCAVTQPAGVKSVLGDFKFKFPNKHSVYMHDTLTPGLFKQTHRILSHGCVRVQNPKRMAEVLLANDKGMSTKRISSVLARKRLHTEHLTRKVPVHMTYFSTWIGEDDSVSHYRDYYGHDKRLAQALLGKGHLFKGAVYGGRARSRPRRPRVKPAPNVLPDYMRD